MDNKTKIESMAADLHLLAAPFRFLFAAVKVMLFTMSFPLLCGLVVLQYAVGNIDPFHRYMEVVQAHRIPLAVYPFVVLGALLLLAVTMLLVIARDLGGMADILLRAPLLGTVLFALASTAWFIVIRGTYRQNDGQKKLGGWSSLLLGFTVAMVGGYTYRRAKTPCRQRRSCASQPWLLSARPCFTFYTVDSNQVGNVRCQEPISRSRGGRLMEMFDEIVSTKIENGKVAVEREATEDTLHAEAMQEACGMFLTAERKFQKLNSNPRCVTDPKLNNLWWEALESVYERERVVWRLFVGPQPDLASNKLYAKFRKLLLEGSKLKADA